MESPGKRRARTLPIFFVLLLSLQPACDAPPPPDTRRLVGSIPPERFVFGDASVEQVFRWEFQQPADLGPWRIRADQRAELEEGALWLSGSDRSSLIRDVDFAARDVDVIEVRLQGLRRGATRVFWAEANGVFAPDREVMLRAIAGGDGVYRFEVGKHPQWTGRIRHLRLDPTNAPDETVSVVSVVGLRASGRLRADAFDRIWSIDAGRELRAGVVVTAGRSHQLPLTTMDASRLHFATSLLPDSASAPARFSISRIEDETEQEIWSREAAATDEGWHADSVELEPTGGYGAILRFAVDCPGASDCAAAFGSMEVRPVRRDPRPNVVLISIDTLRPDRMSLYGNENPTTPRIDAWAADTGVTFEQTVAAAPWTLPSHASMLTGLAATSHNANYNTPLPESMKMLAERLHDDGYFTAAVTGGGFVAPGFGFRQGFDVYAWWGRGEAYGDGETASGTELPRNLARATGLLQESAGRPFFLFFHTYEVHGPFHPQEPYFERFYPNAAEVAGSSVSSRRVELTTDSSYKLSRELLLSDGAGQRRLPEEDLPLLRALYDSGVAYTDARIGELLDVFEADGLLDNTIVVLTSDHGEMLGEEGLGGHAYLHEPNLLIPLVISWPERFAGGLRIEDQVGSVDIVPTLLDLLGREVPAESDGESLVPFLEGRSMSRDPRVISYAAVSNHGVSLRFEDGLKYVFDNSLWRNGTVDSLAPIDPSSPAASLDFSARAAELRREVEQLLEGRPGLHMLLVNDDGPDEIVFRFRGPPMQQGRLKATRLDCQCAHWLGGARSEVRLPSGREIAIQIEDPLPGLIRIEAVVDGEIHHAEVDIEQLDEPFVIDWRDGVWRQINLRDELVSRGLALWWAGGERGLGGGELDEQVLRQLQALGYLR